MSNKAMPVTSVLLATDEVSELPNYARQIFESDEWFGDDPAPVTRNLASELSNHGFQVSFTKLDELADSLSTRAKLGIIYHAILCARLLKRFAIFPMISLLVMVYGLRPCQSRSPIQ